MMMTMISAILLTLRAQVKMIDPMVNRLRKLVDQNIGRVHIPDVYVYVYTHGQPCV